MKAPDEKGDISKPHLKFNFNQEDKAIKRLGKTPTKIKEINDAEEIIEKKKNDLVDMEKLDEDCHKNNKSNYNGSNDRNLAHNLTLARVLVIYGAHLLTWDPGGIL